VTAADIVKEVAIMRLLANHPNTVQLHQVLQDATSFYMVMQLCNGGCDYGRKLNMKEGGGCRAL
jgi:serine/threonine protein kinase